MRPISRGSTGICGLLRWATGSRTTLCRITETRLLTNDRDVLGLFRGSPFGSSPPRIVRAVLWQYWFTTLEEKRRTGNWWKRKLLGAYAPAIERTADGHFGMVAPAGDLPPHD